MKKNKFIYSLSVLALACVISFSGVGGSYIQARASSGAFDVLWNTDDSAWNNIVHHMVLWGSVAGVAISPNILTSMALAASATEFYNYMISDGYTEEEAEETVHGGGGHVRDGISVDESGNVTYSDEVCDLFHGFTKSYIDSNCGYFTVMSLGLEDFKPSQFYSLNAYNNFCTIVRNSNKPYYYFFISNIRNVYIRSIDGYLVGSNKKEFDYTSTLSLYDKNWLLVKNNQFVYTDYYIRNGTVYFDVSETNHDMAFCLDRNVNTVLCDCDWFTDDYYKDKCINDFPCGLSEDHVGLNGADVSYLPSGLTDFKYKFLWSDSRWNTMIVAPTRTPIKVFKTVDAMKNYSVGNQPYYVTDSFNNYNSSIDNSVTMTSTEYAYYNDNSTTMYQTIQNNITNYGGEIDETTVQKIVDDAVKEIKDSIVNSGNDGSGGSENGGSDNGGSGVGDLVGGIGKLLDTVLSLIGKVMGVVADFTQSILDLFTGFTDFTDGFSNFLSGAFAFIPIEIWNVIQVGLSLMILLAVIKFLRK